MEEKLTQNVVAPNTGLQATLLRNAPEPDRCAAHIATPQSSTTLRSREGVSSKKRKWYG